ncbi:ABC transporter permease [Nibricoccus aquaticus]|uniref:ABC transporter permease n=1 Tax=Nibricoccus aquaticus TaxID=2576891 RepID=UPI001FE5AC30|nr:ABC transporter permease [Nibricoccus aquaticus]
MSTLVTAGSIALAAGLLMAVWMVKTQAQRAFTETTTGFDAVLGARGSKLQLVLNAIFHLEASPGNLAWADYEQIAKHPAVKAAVPIAVGDNFEGWRIVGTVPELFTTVEFDAGRRYAFASGGIFGDGREAVVGSFAAQKLGWKVGDTFRPYHGLNFDPAAQHEEVFKVVGILAPTNTPADRVIWIPIKGVQTMSGHDPRAATDVSAVLLQLRAATAGIMLDVMYNKQGNRLTLAYPTGAIIADLFSKIGWFDRVLELVAYLVALVAAGSVLACIYASMSARQRDIAILRALGARRRTIFGAVVAEAAAIGALGAVAGFGIYFGLLVGVAEVIRAQTGVVLAVSEWHEVLWMCPLGMIVLAALGGIVPAVKAYRVPVAETLAPVS